MFRPIRLPLIFFLCLFFSVIYSILSVIHHNHFLSGAFDLGIYDQAIWQYAHFLSPFNTIKEKIILGDHLTLTLPLLAPLYWVWDNVRIALIFQAVWVSFSAFPLYNYLRVRGLTHVQSLLLSFIYLLFYGMQSMIYFDFHPVAIGIGLLAWMVYLWEIGRWKWFALCALLLLLTQENMGVALLGFCIIWFFQGKRKKTVFLLAGISILYVLLAFLAIKLIAHGDLQYVPQFPHSFAELVTRFFDTKEKRDVWIFSFGWYSFLPLFSPGTLAAVVLDLAQYFITGEAFNHMWTPYLHHRAILSLFLLVGTADVLLFLQSKKIQLTYLIVGMLLVSFFMQFHFHFYVNKLTKSEFVKSQSWMKDNEDVTAHIPKNGSIAAQQSLVPHVSHRKEIYLVYPRIHTFDTSVCPKKECWWLDFSGKPDYLVVDTHDNEWLTMTLTPIDNFREALTTMENAHAIRLVYRKNEARIYRIDTEILSAIKR